MLTTKRSLSLGILAGITTLGITVSASAQTAQSTVILNTATVVGYRAPNDPNVTTSNPAGKRRDGAGAMDTTVNFDPQTGEIFSFFTNSVEWGGSTGLNTGMQLALAYTKLTTTGLSTPTFKQMTLQGYNGEQRVAMRPLTLLGKDFVAVVMADENDGPNADGNPQPVTWVYDRNSFNQLNVTNAGTVGQKATDPINLYTLSGDNDGQQLSPHSYCKIQETDGSESWLIGLQYNNTQARVMKVNYKTDGAGGVAVTVPYETTIVGQAQHARPSIACPAPDATTSGQLTTQYAVVTSVEANVRPADVGIRLVLVDLSTGKKAASTLAVAAQSSSNLWAVQPTVQYISPGVVALQYQMANAPYDRHDQGGNEGDPDNHTGSPQLSYLATYSVPTGLNGAFTMIQQASRVAPYNRHAEAVGINYGAEGSTTRAVAVDTGSSTGGGPGLMQVIPIRADGTFDAPDPMKVYQIAQYSDVANLPAMRKRDPDQARGFIHAFEGLPNPGYGIKTGFMPEVRTFTVSAVAGVVDPTTDNNDSLNFTLIPSTWDPSYNTTPGSATSNVPPGPSPVAQPGTPVTNPTAPSSGGASASNGSTGSGSVGGGSTGGGGAGLHTGFGNTSGSSNGCGCTTAGSDKTSGTAGFAALGLGFAFLSLRRRNAKKES
jgi:MYXO-CTERM domain-containing protein